MARIAGVDLPRNKRIVIALTYIHGIGRTTAHKICDAAGLDENLRTDHLSEADIRRIRREIEEHYKVEGDLRREVQLNIKRLMDLGCYRGLRHRRGLPVNGQRTHWTQGSQRGVWSSQIDFMDQISSDRRRALPPRLKSATPRLSASVG